MHFHKLSKPPRVCVCVCVKEHITEKEENLLLLISYFGMLFSTQPNDYLFIYLFCSTMEKIDKINVAG